MSVTSTNQFGAGVDIRSEKSVLFESIMNVDNNSIYEEVDIDLEMNNCYESAKTDPVIVEKNIRSSVIDDQSSSCKRLPLIALATVIAIIVLIILSAYCVFTLIEIAKLKSEMSYIQQISDSFARNSSNQVSNTNINNLRFICSVCS